MIVLTNSDCTVYHRVRIPDGHTWKRRYIPAVWWHEETKSSITTEGLKTADVLKARIPDISVLIKKDDIIIKGNVNVEIGTIKDLSGVHYYKVETANYNQFGSNPHIKVVGV